MSRNNDEKDRKKDNTDSPINNKHELKIGDEFLKILGNNAFNGTDGGDVIDHINKILEITEWIKIHDVDKNELRLHIFSKSLSGDAKIWWSNEIEGTTISWNEICNKFSHKYYPLSHVCNSKDGKDIYEIINREYSPIPVPARRDISNPDELCKTKEFTVIQYSMGLDEEFVVVGPSKISTVERTPGSMSCIYHDLFNKKDR
ncbi:hypothetical protein Tco_0241229 [Tanacetum coccineum]